MENSEKVLDTVTLAAKILLQSGAEIYRVQDTTLRMLEHSGSEDHNVYVIANGFFINIDEHSDGHRTSIRHVPLQGVHLSQIMKVNEISREYCEDHITLEEAHEQLKACEQPPKENKMLMIAASGIGAFGFCYLFGGTVLDCFFALPLGLILQVLLYQISGKSKYICYLLGSILVTAGAALFAALLPACHFNSVVIGAIIPLVPGVAFSTSINELFNGDHVSGTIHLMDSIMSAVCIAVGVGAVIFVLNGMGVTL